MCRLTSLGDRCFLNLSSSVLAVVGVKKCAAVSWAKKRAVVPGTHGISTVLMVDDWLPIILSKEYRERVLPWQKKNNSTGWAHGSA